MVNSTKKERLSQAQKNANDFKWYRDKADELDIYGSTDNTLSNSYTSEYKRMKVNYDLYNNIINLKDFDYVCKPFGDVGELPADMVNRDIISGKIKALLGMEAKRPFSWKVLATNSEATSRKEAEQFEIVRNFTVSSIMTPIRQKIEKQKFEELQGRQPNEKELQEINKAIEEELQAQTPPEIKKYMEREHQDPAEIQAQQLLNYFSQKENIDYKFNKAFFHGAASAIECIYVGMLNDELVTFNINSIRFRCDKSPDVDFIEDGEWAMYEHRWTPSQVVKYFGKELTDKQIDDIYEHYSKMQTTSDIDWSFTDPISEDHHSRTTISVRHFVWKALRKIGFLTRQTIEDEEPVEVLVDETYKLNKDAGDIKLEWYHIPEVYETWKVGTDIYLSMQPIPGQFKDIHNLYHCKLPYYGAVYDNINSQNTCIIDRLKYFQYYFNIIMYRIELLMASDDGKKILMNINAIPDSAAMPMETWKHFFKSSPFMYFDPSEEGVGYNDLNQIAKVLDLSLASDISKYIELAENIRQQAGRAVGITDQVEGDIGRGEAVTNVQQGLAQSSNILEPYFLLHNNIKKNVLQAILETAKVVYSGQNKVKLSYALDDMSLQMLDLDVNLLDSTTLGIFISNSTKGAEAKQLINQLTHAAMQTQQATLSDVIAVIRQDGILESEEILKAAEDKKHNQLLEIEKQKSETQKEMLLQSQAHEEKLHEMKLEEILVKEEARRETEIQKAALMASSFNPDQDIDNDGENDFIEILKNGVDADIKRSKLSLDRDKLNHQKSVDKEKLKLEKAKLNSKT